jgi:hypothetical protein
MNGGSGDVFTGVERAAERLGGDAEANRVGLHVPYLIAMGGAGSARLLNDNGTVRRFRARVLSIRKRGLRISPE